GKQISPRLVTIIILDEAPVPGNTGYTIDAFAGFYLAGCASGKKKASLADMDPKCPVKGGGPPGHLIVFGNFVNLLVPGSGVGPPGPSTTSFSIALVD
ncbi:MAG TPA: hypothetical protein VFT91_00125, partial [Dehalococcoidia bacterium]|nr:hypothetical protein [Dehalococcoidia bacterium]